MKGRIDGTATVSVGQSKPQSNYSKTFVSFTLGAYELHEILLQNLKQSHGYSNSTSHISSVQHQTHAYDLNVWKTNTP